MCRSHVSIAEAETGAVLNAFLEFVTCTKELKELTAELENEEYEDDDWFMDDDDPYYGLPGIDPDYEEWLCDIGEDPWGGHW